jgi:molecular chaperone GrpE
MKKSTRAEKLKRLEEALNAEQVKFMETLDQIKYLQADFENYRKRVDKEVEEMTRRSNERLITNILCVMDDLERAIQTGQTTDNAKALLEGVEMVQKKLSATLEQEGLIRIEAVGKSFDPNLHELLAKTPSKDHEEGTVVEEARKGYIFKGKVIRPSVVKIACREGEVKQDE